MKKNRRLRIFTTLCVLASICSGSLLADTGSKAMQFDKSADNGTVAERVTAERAEAIAAAFEADMARLTSDMNLAAAEATPTEAGVHSRVLGLNKMRMLTVKKNGDGSVTVGHVSDAESVKRFIDDSATETTTEEE